VKTKTWLGNIIYWLFAIIDVALILNAGHDESYPVYPVFDIGHILAAGGLYLIGRDIRRVLTGAP
jgi:hypothetical protein